jgi:hypothetical protein
MTPEKKGKKKDPFLRDLERELSSKLMTEIHIRQRKNKGSIDIKFKTAEELNRLVTMLLNVVESKRISR